jgi:hypothetical protein
MNWVMVRPVVFPHKETEAEKTNDLPCCEARRILPLGALSLHHSKCVNFAHRPW